MVLYNDRSAKLLVYTREPDENAYPNGLARSIHFAVSQDGHHFHALHNNYGILFAEATISENDTIQPRGVRNPVVFPLPEGGFGIAAERVKEDGSVDETSCGKLLLWKTVDFIDFNSMGLVEESSLEDGEEKPHIRETVVIEGETVSGCSTEIDLNLCNCIMQKWCPIHHVDTYLPQSVTITSLQELETLRAVAAYSDGSTAVKRVKWQKEQVDFSKPGTYQVNGTLCQREYPFPLAQGYGDPVIFPWEGKWYFLGTNDNLNDIGIYAREADTVEGLFAEGVKEHLILDVDEEKDFIQTFWAPEFHIIGGELYILLAIGGKVWGPQCYLMKFKSGGSIVDANSWETPVKVLRKDGSPLASDGITLDMTYLLAGGNSYVVWSYRRHIGTPMDTGSMLYIAKVDESKPWQLAGEPVLLSRPLYGWENVSGTINNEGPHAFVHNGKVYLAYSGGDARGYLYALGLMTAEETKDLTDVSVWKKSCAPVLSFYSMKGVFGPGHNSFFVDDDGNLMIAYHGETALESRLCCDGIHRMHFDVKGEPRFDLSSEKDLNPALCKVSIQVMVC